jgi:hypothetical protein
MKIIKHVCVIVIFLLLVSMGMDGATLAAQEKNPIIEKTLKELIVMKDLTAPGENHKHLEYFIGNWESAVKLWVEPGTDPLCYRQDIFVKFLLGGRITYAEIKSNILGAESDQVVITGYDSIKKEFYQVTFSDLGTRYTTSAGTLDKSGKIRTETLLYEDSATGEKVTFKFVTTLIDNNKYTFDVYQIDSKGKETKGMEVTYFRKK